MEPQVQACTICQDNIVAAGEPTEALSCGHVFHRYCINMFCQHRELDLESVGCPTCRCTSADLDHVAMEVESSPAASLVNVPVQPPAEAAPLPAAPAEVAPLNEQTAASRAEVASSSNSRPAPVPWPAPMAQCCFCGEWCDPIRLRVRGKTNGSWQCNKCNCKTVQLSRIFGAWPPPGLEAAPKDQLQEFFRNTQGLNPVATKAKFDESLSGYVVSEEYFACEGEYLPPAVWATRGFDAERTAGLHSLLYVVHSSIAAFR